MALGLAIIIHNIITVKHVQPKFHPFQYVEGKKFMELPRYGCTIFTFKYTFNILVALYNNFCSLVTCKDLFLPQMCKR